MELKRLENDHDEHYEMPDAGPEPCDSCDTTGLVAGHKCKDCDGKGYFHTY
jgi:DnaJ-class molecular chaperone